MPRRQASTHNSASVFSCSECMDSQRYHKSDTRGAWMGESSWEQIKDLKASHIIMLSLDAFLRSYFGRVHQIQWQARWTLRRETIRDPVALVH